ncbi:MAG: isoaspartyl peptidase/L-asparaginase, partial [Candidatus Binatia bacterium]
MLRPALIVHGGAGAENAALSAARRAGCTAAVDAAWQVLLHGGSAVDAVCEAVAAMENVYDFRWINRRP